MFEQCIYIDVVFFKKYPCEENDTHTKEITFYIYIYMKKKTTYAVKLST